MDTLIVAVRVALSLGVVLALLWYLQRRLSRGARALGVANPVTVVGRQPIGQKASVVVVEVDGTRLVLGVTEQAVTVLHEKYLVPATVSTLDAAISVLGGSQSAPATAFARSLAAAEADDAARVAPPAASAPLAGSILSPSTWRQTAALLRQGR
ncbi:MULTISPECIES: flagellar biosynthetic protein FliO [Cryobacterium]|uniref:Flagellar protein n=1 Tax=Cryobacterium lyxosi TaxID=1259228 RepID=A0A4V3INN6_9MICO|nr:MULTISPECIES: flagellar biosynthetic protein FliO [Cryobacterium]TFD23838.1 flagellar biosynthetic protein FliO [Cryobacterium lyxosi]